MHTEYSYRSGEVTEERYLDNTWCPMCHAKLPKDSVTKHYRVSRPLPGVKVLARICEKCRNERREFVDIKSED